MSADWVVPIIDEMGIRRISRAVLLVTALVLAVVAGAMLGSGTTATASEGSDPSTAPFVVNTSSGLVIIHDTPGQTVIATARSAGVVRARATGVIGSDGTVTLDVGWFDGVGGGVHAGDVVTADIGSRHLEQQISLAGYLDEVTGTFTGWSLPGSTITLNVYTRGSRAVLAGSTRGTANSAGVVTIDLASSVTPPSDSGPTPWRGYAADVFAEATPGQVQSRVVQTTNATILATNGHVSASYLAPGATAAFELRRSGAVVAQASAVANGAGVAGTTLPVEVAQGDVLAVGWTDTSGAPRSLVLTPFSLDAAVDVATGVLTGRTAPGSKVVGIYDGPAGEVSVKATAASDGTFTMTFPPLVGDQLLIVWRVSDPGATGVGVDRIHLHTPVVRVDTVSRVVSGFGQHWHHALAIELWRGTSLLDRRTATSELAGRFQKTLAVTPKPGDRVKVVPDSGPTQEFTLPPNALTMGGTATSLSGTASPGWQVSVTTTCSASTTVDSKGTWALTLPCGVKGATAQVTQVAVGGASAGSAAGYFTTLP